MVQLRRDIRLDIRLPLLRALITNIRMHPLPILQPSMRSQPLQHPNIRSAVLAPPVRLHPAHQIARNSQIIRTVLARRQVEFHLGLTGRGGDVEEIDETLTERLEVLPHRSASRGFDGNLLVLGEIGW